MNDGMVYVSNEPPNFTLVRMPYLGCPVEIVHEDCNDKHVRHSAAFVTGGVTESDQYGVIRVGLFVMPHMQGPQNMDRIQLHQTKEAATAEFMQSKGVPQAYFPR